MLWYKFCSNRKPKRRVQLCLCVNTGTFTRIRNRCADFVHLLILEQTIRGYLLGDLVALIGNIDCVFGSIDR